MRWLLQEYRKKTVDFRAGASEFLFHYKRNCQFIDSLCFCGRWDTALWIQDVEEEIFLSYI